MPQSSRLKSAKAPSPRLFYSSRCRPWREGLARAHGLEDLHSNHSEVSHHRQNLALHLTYQHAPKPKALDQSYLTSIVKVHHTSLYIVPEYPHQRAHLNYHQDTCHRHPKFSLTMRNAHNPYQNERTSRTNSLLQGDPTLHIHP